MKLTLRSFLFTMCIACLFTGHGSTLANKSTVSNGLRADGNPPPVCDGKPGCRVNVNFAKV